MVTRLTTSTEFFDLMADLYTTNAKYRTTQSEGKICYVYFDPNLTSQEKSSMKNALLDRLFQMTDIAAMPT